MQSPSISAAGGAPGEEDWSEYISWCRQSLGIHVSPSLQVRSDTSERGVFALSDIAKGESLVAVPFDSLLTVLSPLRCSQETQPKALSLSGVLGQLTREDDALALRILWERYEMAGDSVWAKHLAVVPDSYESAVHWSQHDLAQLTGSRTQQVAETWQAQVIADFAALASIEVSASTDINGLNGSCMKDHFEWFTVDNYRWALSTIWSRCCSVHVQSPSGEQTAYKALAPFFDLFNHSPSSKSIHGLMNAQIGEETKPALGVISGEAWTAGQEVYLNYGPEGNGRLISLYGFCVEQNPFDKVELWATLGAEAPHFERKVQMLDMHGVKHTEPLAMTLDDPLPQKMLATIRVQRASQEELSQPDLIALAFQGQMLSPSNESIVLQALQNGIESMLDGYCTTTAQDQAALAEAINYKNKMAVVLRMSEKNILHLALEQLALKKEDLELANEMM